MTRTTAMGIVIGLALGLAVAFGNFGDMLIVALFGAIGFVIAKVLEGDLDLGRLPVPPARQPMTASTAIQPAVPASAPGRNELGMISINDRVVEKMAARRRDRDP